jgi:hypothetical protein
VSGPSSSRLVSAIDYAVLVGKNVRMEIESEPGLTHWGVVVGVTDWAEADAVDVTFEGGIIRTIDEGNAVLWRFWIQSAS